ncbi:MAG TPA: glycosyhydrolase, partial [Marinilabiliaceae bacterium]|nr:glycosyhydrolase [Marinilabiliaceae bacterium]
SRYIKELIKKGKINGEELKGKNEKYLMAVVDKPLSGVKEALVIAGSDKRGAIYGIYELSEQIGVSPWYDWADVPVVPNQNLSITRGTYTAGEPVVEYRGIFLNDEAPSLTSWVYNTYGTDYGDHRFYS